jgi:hypothetical protein
MSVGRWAFVAGDREVEDVGTLVVDVVLELDASDGDAQPSCISRPVVISIRLSEPAPGRRFPSSTDRAW